MNDARRRTALAAVVATVATLAGAATTAHAAELGGSRRSMVRQHGIAVAAQLSFVGTRAEVRTLVAGGVIERVTGNADYRVDAQVAHPFARPEVVLFLERLGAEYRAALGTPLVVTSLVRAESEQPANASPLSVHPAGMAVDLRVPASLRGQRWLERTLLRLEAQGVLDVTREQRPPHYHVAIFPDAYRAHVARLDSAARAASAPAVATATVASPVVAVVPVIPRPVAAPVVPARVHSPQATGGAALAAGSTLAAFGLVGVGVVRRRRRHGDTPSAAPTVDAVGG